MVKSVAMAKPHDILLIMIIFSKYKIVTFTILIAAVCVLFYIGVYPSQQPFPQESNRPLIVTTTAHIADLVHNIAGDAFTVKSLMGPGTDPHLYRPVRSDVAMLSQAEIIIYNGQHLEGQMVDLMNQFAKEKFVLGVANDIKELIKSDENSYDPHIWMDVKNWIEAANIVENALSENRPDLSQQFVASKKIYQNKLELLDKKILKAIQSIPENNRILITAHDAFGYYGRAYGIEVIGIQGLSTSSEASLNKIEKLVQKITNQKIPAIFVEVSVSEQNVKAIKEGVKANGRGLSIGGTLYSDSLGKSGTPTGTYIGMMIHNTNTISRALGGDAVSMEKHNETTVIN